MKTTFDTSPQLTKKKDVRDINAEPEMIELKRMVREGKLDTDQTIKNVKGERSMSICEQCGGQAITCGCNFPEMGSVKEH